MVACTMTLTDLHKLDGLPFDLIVLAGLDSTDSLPEQIRSDYRVFEIDLVGEGRVARSLRDQLAGACRAALDHLVESGVRRPGLVFSGDAGAAARLVYEAWCAERGVTASITDAADPTRSFRGAGCRAQTGVDGFFSVLADGRWLVRGTGHTRRHHKGATGNRSRPRSGSWGGSGWIFQPGPEWAEAWRTTRRCRDRGPARHPTTRSNNGVLVGRFTIPGSWTHPPR